MYARTIKKAIVLFVVYLFLIIGIFVLQFSNDSIITEKIGSLQITLSEKKDGINNSILKNELQINFNGISFLCDDTTPAFIVRGDSEAEEPVKLVDWEKQTPLDYKFYFTEDVVFNLSLSDESETAGLSLSVELPPSVEDFYLPYSIAINTETSRQSLTRLVVNLKKGSWEFATPYSSEEYLHLTSTLGSATYSYYVESVEFKFSNFNDATVSSDYAMAVRAFRDSIISSFKANTSEAISYEAAVVAYIAEQAQRGNYTSAIGEIPQSFRRSSSRTYLSAPYFNSLSEMNSKLESELKSKENLIRKASETYSLDLFTIRNIAEHLYIYPNSLTVKRILENAGGADVQNCSIAECAGLLRAYVEMSALSTSFAKNLVPVLDDCVVKIENSCKMEDSNLTISENGTFLSVVQAIEVGDALMRYGEFIGDDTVITGGKALIASYLGENPAFDIRTLSDLYPVIVTGNSFYPHFVKIFVENDNVIWAWTVARGISYERRANGNVIYTIDFPLDYTHYMIIRGVPVFRNIYIYDTPFRTDSRFESYNSSGYVYRAETEALLLKSRHKEEKEVIRLVYPSEPIRRETPVVSQPNVVTEPASEIVESQIEQEPDQP